MASRLAPAYPLARNTCRAASRTSSRLRSTCSLRLSRFLIPTVFKYYQYLNVKCDCLATGRRIAYGLHGENPRAKPRARLVPRRGSDRRERRGGQDWGTGIDAINAAGAARV